MYNFFRLCFCFTISPSVWWNFFYFVFVLFFFFLHSMLFIFIWWWYCHRGSLSFRWHFAANTLKPLKKSRRINNIWDCYLCLWFCGLSLSLSRFVCVCACDSMSLIWSFCFCFLYNITSMPRQGKSTQKNPTKRKKNARFDGKEFAFKRNEQLLNTKRSASFFKFKHHLYVCAPSLQLNILWFSEITDDESKLCIRINTTNEKKKPKRIWLLRRILWCHWCGLNNLCYNFNWEQEK